MRAKPGYISLDGLAGAVHHGHTAAGDERTPRDGLHLAGKIFRENISETGNISTQDRCWSYDVEGGGGAVTGKEVTWPSSWESPPRGGTSSLGRNSSSELRWL